MLVFGKETTDLCECSNRVVLRVADLQHRSRRSSFVTSSNLVVQLDRLIVLFETPVAGCHVSAAIRQTLRLAIISNRLLLLF